MAGTGRPDVLQGHQGPRPNPRIVAVYHARPYTVASIGLPVVRPESGTGRPAVFIAATPRAYGQRPLPLVIDRNRARDRLPLCTDGNLLATGGILIKLMASYIETMNRITLSLLTLLLTVGLVSCNKWLDIRPETEVDGDVLLSTAEGYEEALLGVYSRSTQNDLYGKELTIGTPEVLAQHYTISNQDPLRYLRTSQYAYNDGDFIARKDRIWKGLYHAIANCNLILAIIDDNSALFSPGIYELIKGEALALRAYLHFDALRLFAPAPASDASADAIPYVTAYSKNTTPLSTVNGVLDSAIRDLQAAKALLENDPIRDAGY